MIKILWLLILLIFLSQDSYCDDIYLKDGTVYRNVEIISVDSIYFVVKFFIKQNKGWSEIGKEIVSEKIYRSAIVNHVKKRINDTDLDNKEKYDVFERDSSLWYTKKKYTHLGFLSVTLISGILIYDYWEDIDRMNKNINSYQEQLGKYPQHDEIRRTMQMTLDDLIAVRDRKEIVRGLLFVSLFGSLIYAFIPEQVEVKLTPINVGIKYNF